MEIVVGIARLVLFLVLGVVFVVLTIMALLVLHLVFSALSEVFSTILPVERFRQPSEQPEPTITRLFRPPEAVPPPPPTPVAEAKVDLTLYGWKVRTPEAESETVSSRR
jgi:hypothetical protein